MYLYLPGNGQRGVFQTYMIQPKIEEKKLRKTERNQNRTDLMEKRQTKQNKPKTK